MDARTRGRAVLTVYLLQEMLQYKDNMSVLSDFGCPEDMGECMPCDVYVLPTACAQFARR